MNSNLKKVVTTALFAALACVATMSIRIPTPGTSGYIHPGDAIVILTGVFLGPGWGFLAGGIGSAMADLLGGYFVYVPITFVIKGLISLISGLIYQKLGTTSKSRYTAVILGGVVDIVLVAGGYFLCEAVFLYGFAASAASFACSARTAAMPPFRERVMEEIMPTIAKISRITANTVMTVILASMQYQARISAVSTSR